MWSTRRRAASRRPFRIFRLARDPDHQVQTLYLGQLVSSRRAGHFETGLIYPTRLTSTQLHYSRVAAVTADMDS